MPRRKGEPTQVVRLYVADAEWLTRRAEAQEISVAEAFARTRQDPADRRRARAAEVASPGRCVCATPTFSKAVSNLCTTCHLMR